ncbi:F-box protein At5g07610-like [Papaver somniferum]|uniref:F-box protein At5g07610-like n=1 Tax=Papaver somniferum TaxID=3469 RepID=UPI000E6FB9C6|nr:F-box protein At5g07610-like [Papaver somniferum]
MNSISRSSSSSSDIIGNNVDLFTRVLLCLPVKPLLVFKSVSKQWFSGISYPLFIKQHTQKQNLRSLMMQTASKIPTFEFISLDGSSSSSVSFGTLDFLRARIQQSCNGLLCCSSHNKDNEIFTYYICNPATKKYRRIVDFTVDMAKGKGFEMLVSVSLAYDPLKSPNYKAICVWKMSPEQCIRWSYRIEIYSSETDSWKLCGDVFFLPPCIINTSGVYWNGSLHWVDTWDHENHICFNVDQELRSGMPPCSSLVYSTAYSVVEYFGECRGRLHHISRYGHPQVACII